MAKTLVPLKVKIELTTSGHAKYPTFNALACVVNSGMDWSQYIDVHGSGWLYDADGHQDDTPDSPAGQQWGLILVPQVFATQAIAAFPTTCSALTAAEATTFYENKHARDFPDEDIDEKVLSQIKVKQDLGLPLTTQQRRAIDPRDSERGIRPNRRKAFSTFKADRGFNVVDPT